MKEFDLLESRSVVLNGKPVVKGTRISVELILEMVATGGTPESIHAVYQHVPIEGIRQAILFAASLD